MLVSAEGDVKLADFGVTVQLTDTMTKRQTMVRRQAGGAVGGL